jgi:hypothetical protein
MILSGYILFCAFISLIFYFTTKFFIKMGNAKLSDELVKRYSQKSAVFFFLLFSTLLILDYFELSVL